MIALSGQVQLPYGISTQSVDIVVMILYGRTSSS